MATAKSTKKPSVDRFTWHEGDVKITPPKTKKPEKGKPLKKLTSK